MGNFGNRMGNTAGVPVRLAGSGVTVAADLGNTYYNLGKESYEVLGNTTQNIKDVFLGAWNHGKWYHKALNVPLSPVIATGTMLEGAVRSVVQPVINGVANTWNTGKNFFKNIGRSFGRVFSKKPISDFSYDHLKTRESNLKQNRFSKLQFQKK